MSRPVWASNLFSMELYDLKYIFNSQEQKRVRDYDKEILDVHDWGHPKIMGQKEEQTLF